MDYLDLGRVNTDFRVCDLCQRRLKALAVTVHADAQLKTAIRR